MKWISVQDEMPNINFEVIVSDKHGCVTTAWYVKEGDNYWFETYDNELFEKVTHWMPLPTSPNSQ